MVLLNLVREAWYNPRGLRAATERARHCLLRLGKVRLQEVPRSCVWILAPVGEDVCGGQTLNRNIWRECWRLNTRGIWA